MDPGVQMVGTLQPDKKLNYDWPAIDFCTAPPPKTMLRVSRGWARKIFQSHVDLTTLFWGRGGRAHSNSTNHIVVKFLAGRMVFLICHPFHVL